MRHYREPREPNQKLIEALKPIFELIEGYFNLEVHGQENIPIGKRFVWTHNHTGWPSLDALVIGKQISDKNFAVNKKYGGGLAFWHDLMTKAPIVKHLIAGLGGLSIADLESYPHYKEHMIFATPGEGEEGNFKSSFTQRYQMTRFRSGVGRIACNAKVDYLLPVSIVGPEESFPNFGNIRIPIRDFLGQLGNDELSRWIRKKVQKISSRDILIPIIAPIQGLPFKWRIYFHRPIDISDLVAKSGATVEQDREICQEIARLAEKVIASDLKMQTAVRTPFKPVFPKVLPVAGKLLKQGSLRAIDALESRLRESEKFKKWAYGQPSNDGEMAEVIDFPRKASTSASAL